MPKIESWDKLPERVRQHLMERMRDRAINIADLNQLRLWIESLPEVPEGDWYTDFGSFKICGRGSFPKTFLLRGRPIFSPGKTLILPRRRRHLARCPARKFCRLQFICATHVGGLVGSRPLLPL
jgi:hypothetical protein